MDNLRSSSTCSSGIYTKLNPNCRSPPVKGYVWRMKQEDRRTRGQTPTQDQDQDKGIRDEKSAPADTAVAQQYY